MIEFKYECVKNVTYKINLKLQTKDEKITDLDILIICPCAFRFLIDDIISREKIAGANKLVSKTLR